MLSKRKLFLFFLGIVGFNLGIVATLFQERSYRAKASIEFQEVNDNLLHKRDLDATGSSSNGDIYVQTQLRILQSETLLERTLLKLDIQHRPDRPHQQSAFQKVLSKLGWGAPPNELTMEQYVAYFAAGLKLRSPDQTRIVEIQADSSSPALSAAFVNTLAKEYIEQIGESRWENAQDTEKWLSKQIVSLRSTLENSEREMQRYAHASGLLFTAEKDNINDEKLRQIQQELSRAEADLIVKKAHYDVATSSPPTALPEVLDNGPLKDYQMKLGDLQRQYAELSTTLTAENPKVQKVRAQINELRTSIEQERQNVVHRIKNDYDAALRRKRALVESFSTQTGAASEETVRIIRYNLLKREVDTNRLLYESLLQKVKEYGIASTMRANHVRFVDGAKAPTAPYRPNVAWNAGIGLFSGLLLAVGLVLTHDHTDRTLRSPREARALLNIRELGAIPIIPAATAWHRFRNKLRVVGLSAPASASLMSVWQNESSVAADSFRGVLASVLFASRHLDISDSQQPGAAKMLVVTSPDAMAGKTTTAVNLAIALAETGRRILLVDGDLRKPRLHQLFDLPQADGLREVVPEMAQADTTDVMAAVKTTVIPGLSIVTAGAGTGSAADVLYAQHASLVRFLDLCRAEFDFILIDTPPMLVLPDARQFSRIADAVVLVLRASQTNSEDALAACEQMAVDNTTILGVILNYWNPDLRSYSNYY